MALFYEYKYTEKIRTLIIKVLELPTFQFVDSLFDYQHQIEANVLPGINHLNFFHVKENKKKSDKKTPH